MHKYIGLDVHARSCTVAIIDARGKRLGHHVLETNGQVLVEFFKTLSGTLLVCLEEGTQAGWLVEILSPHVERVVTLRVPESRGAKSDERDALGLAHPEGFPSCPLRRERLAFLGPDGWRPVEGER